MIKLVHTPEGELREDTKYYVGREVFLHGTERGVIIKRPPGASAAYDKTDAVHWVKFDTYRSSGSFYPKDVHIMLVHINNLRFKNAYV